MVNQELLEILVCPESKQRLRVADTGTLERLNQAVEEGYLLNQGGDRVKSRIEGGLIREDGEVLYPVQDDIPVMLVDEAIRLDSLKS
ncbi:Trm112 family protein [Gemmatimonadota bacterium]